MKNLKLILTAAVVSTVLATPVMAQSVYERAMDNGNRIQLGTIDRSYAEETVAPVAGPGEMRSGNVTRRGPARGDAYYDDYGYGAWSHDRTWGYGNRTKLGQY
jgi:hypothetical protein